MSQRELVVLVPVLVLVLVANYGAWVAEGVAVQRWIKPCRRRSRMRGGTLFGAKALRFVCMTGGVISMDRRHN